MDGKQINEASSKQTYNRMKNILCNLTNPFNNDIYTGLENKIESGPNLIVANHPGIARDISAVASAYERQLFFTPRKEAFDKQELIQLMYDGLKKSDFCQNKIVYHITKAVLTPFIIPLSGFAAKNMNESEMIPIDISNGDIRKQAYNLRTSLNLISDYLLAGKSVVIFQIGKSIHNVKHPQSKYNDYFHKFKSTPARIVRDLYLKKGISVPLTPIGIYGGEGLAVWKKVKLQIGEPMDIKLYMNESNPVIALTNDLEKNIGQMILEQSEK